MRVIDIKPDAKQVLGYCDDATLFNRLTYAIECLANKGEWDSMTAYLDINVSSGNVVTLPREVETPIKINISGQPAFSRSKLYEFSLNGPGNNMADTSGYSWMDKGEVAVIAQPSTPRTIKSISSAGDNNKTISIWGRDANNLELQDVLVLNSTTPPVTTNVYKEITRVIKDVTISNVQLQDSTNAPLANYYPNETEPQYRQVRLTKPAASIRMLFRRRTNIITSDQDFIPLQSQMAILMMLKALEAFRNGDPAEVQKGQAFETLALQYLKEEQQSRNSFDMAQNTEEPSALDLNYNNADSIIVADIYDDAAQIFGSVGRAKIFDKITESLEALSNKGQWDGLVGYVDILTDNYQYVTFPRYVEAPIAININGTPKMMRNKWFEFHLNGPGSDSSYCKAWDYIGDVVTIRPLPAALQFVAVPDLSDDDNKKITVFGYDQNGKWIRTQVNSVWQDGFQVNLNHIATLPDLNAAQKCSRIERIIKDPTIGFVQLVGYDSAQQVPVQIGYYYPDETEPNYSRIKLPMSSVWIRMKYRKRAMKVSSLTDPIHLKSKLSIMAMMRSLKALTDGEFDKATAWESKAVQFLNEEQSSRNPAEVFDIQFQNMGENNSVII